MRLKYFFSYSRHDTELVKQLATDLKIRNMDVWLDQLDIPIGAKWDTCIEHALNESVGIILVLSTSSVQSDNVMDEVSYAINKGKHIIPILLDDCEVPFRIARIQQINFHTDYNKGIEAIIATVNAHNNLVTPKTETNIVKPPAAPPVKPNFVDHTVLRIEDTTNSKSVKTHFVPAAVTRRNRKIKYTLFISAGLLLLLLWLLTTSSGSDLYSWVLALFKDTNYLDKEKSMTEKSAAGILVVIVVGAVAGWIAGMIVDAGRQSFVLNVVIGIVGSYIASRWIFHGTWRLTDYYYVNLTITATVGAAILAAIIKLVRTVIGR